MFIYIYIQFKCECGLMLSSSSADLNVGWSQAISAISLSFFIQVQVTPLFETCCMPLHFYKRPTLVPVFINQNKSEEDFCFYEKRLKVKIALRVCFAVFVLQRRWAPLAARVALPSSFPGNYTPHLSIKRPLFWAVSVSICLISTYSVHPLATYVLR